MLAKLAGDPAPVRPPPESLRKNRRLIETTIHELKHCHGEQRFCTQTAIEQLQQLIFKSNWNATQLRRLVIANTSHWFGFGREQWRYLDQPLAPALATLRSPWAEADTVARINAVVMLAPVLRHKGKRWFVRRVLQSLIDRLFAWPLLVVDGGKNQAVSFPIGVDLDLVSFPRPGGIEVLMPEAGSSIDASGWKESYPRIMAAVEGGFRHAQGGKAPAWVGRLRVILDFRFAEAVARELAPLKFFDRSMEAYLAGVILARLLGETVTPLTFATGAIGPGEPFFAPLIWPDGVEQKIDHVFATSTSDRILIPLPEHTEPGRDAIFDDYMVRARERQTASVVPVRSVGTVMRIMGGPRAEPHQYVRCPELSLLQTTQLSAPLLSEARFESLQARLNAQDEPFIDLSAHTETVDITAEDVVRYLRTSAGRQVPLSWVVLRVYDEERDDVLWQLVGEALGATEQQIDRLLTSRTPEESADCLATILKSSDEGGLARPVPDVVVILGGVERVARYEEAPDKSAFPCAMKPVLHALASKAVPVRRTSRGVLGNARFVLARANDAVSFAPPPLREAEPEWLDSLRVFRHAFSANCAAHILDGTFLDPKSLRRALSDAADNGWLSRLANRDYLVNCNRGLPQTIKGGDALASLYSRAAHALAPQLARNTQRTGLPAREAMLAQNILEAARFLNLARKARDIPIGTWRYETELIFVQRFLCRRSGMGIHNSALFRQPGLGRIVLERVRDLVSDLEGAGFHVHPYDYAAAGVSGADALTNTTFEEQREVLQSIIKLLDCSVTACDYPQFKIERTYLFVRVVSQYDSFIAKLRDSKLDRLLPNGVDNYLETLNQQAEEFLLADGERLARAPVADWCARRGDLEPDDERAALFYSTGIFHSPFYQQNWVRFFGILERCRTSKSSARLVQLQTAALRKIDAEPDVLPQLKHGFNTMKRSKEVFSARKSFDILGELLGRENFKADRIEKGEAFISALDQSRVSRLLANS